MILRKVEVHNFRCIRDATLDCDRLTIMVGANGCGKSSLLRALEMFYDPAAEYDQEDFHERVTENPIEISLTFDALSKAEKDLFAPYIEEDALTIVKEMTWPPSRTSQRYYGFRLRHMVFEPVRLTKKASDKQRLYEALRQQSDYWELPEWSNLPESVAALDAWETDNPDRCEAMRDDGEFFGFGQVGEAKLERHTRLVLIPAVEDAADQGSEGRETALTQLMDLVVRNALRKREDLMKLRTDFNTKSAKIFERAKEDELQHLQDELTNAVTSLGSEAQVKLEWSAWKDYELPLPEAMVRLVEDGYPAPIDATGHGLQRLFVMALLQRLAAATIQEAEDANENSQQSDIVMSIQEAPSIVMGIEEPELYQHPNRQRTMARVFRQLSAAGIPGVAFHVQIICTTHSPLFLNLDYFDQIRIIRKVRKTTSTTGETSVTQYSLEELTREMERVWGRPEGSFIVPETREKLRMVMTPEVNEGFLADVAVLVEGPLDRAALSGYAASKGASLEIAGISLIPCGGKSNLLHPSAIFRKLRIPTYVVWDNDEEDEKPEVNQRLLRLHSIRVEDFPVFVGADCAALKVNMENTIAQELGKDLFGKLLSMQRA